MLWLLLLLLLSALAATASAGAVLIEPWGADSVRVRLTIGDTGAKVKSGLPGALDPHPPVLRTPTDAMRQPKSDSGVDGGLVTNGNIQASYDEVAGLVVTRVGDGVVLARSLSIGIEPCGTVPPLPSSTTATHHQHHGGAAAADRTAARAPAVCAANMQSDSDWGHNDILVNGQLHPYESTTVADCCARCQRWRPLAGTAHCGGFSWSGPNTTIGPKNMCFLKYGVGQGHHSVGRLTGCVSGVNCTAPPPAPPPPPPAPVPEGCTSKAVARFSWSAEMEAYGTGEHMNTHSITGRLPPGKLGPTAGGLGANSTLPSTDMVGGSWDFQSCTVYSDSSGAEICIPWVIAATPGESYEYGMLWNMPNFGSMTLEKNQTTWVANDPVNDQLDLFFTTYSAGAKMRGTAQAAKDIMSHYVDATGHSPLMPKWAAGYWHSPMGEPNFNQTMVIDAVDGLVARGIPTDLYVIDYFNWAKMGDYTFNPKMWPDPAGMVQHLASKGVRLMVSAWPYTLKDGARASSEIIKPGNGVRFPNGSMTPWPDGVCGGVCYLYDPTCQSGRDFVFDMLDTGYVKYGVKNFWFDASEPESLAHFHNRAAPGLDYNNPLGQPYGSTFSAGTNQQVGMMFPWYHTKMVYDGLMSKFPDEVPVTLARSGWAGSQRFGASNWNGDLSASWENFQKTIVAGLNAQLSGLAWWTHDIGAIGNCNNKDPDYREMLVRWFQFGLTSPIFRQHGSRTVEPWTLQQYGPSGEMAYMAVVKFIKLRYTLRNYTMTLMEEVATKGTPVNRPLSFEFPADANAWNITDQFMFGPRYMTAPVYHLGARARSVYFPVGGGCATWKRWAPAAGRSDTSSAVDDRVQARSDAAETEATCAPKLVGKNLDAPAHDLLQISTHSSAACAAACCANPKCGGAIFRAQNVVPYQACKKGHACCFMKTSVTDHQSTGQALPGGSDLWIIPERNDTANSYAPGTTTTVPVPFDELAMFECMPTTV